MLEFFSVIHTRILVAVQCFAYPWKRINSRKLLFPIYANKASPFLFILTGVKEFFFSGRFLTLPLWDSGNNGQLLPSPGTFVPSATKPDLLHYLKGNKVRLVTLFPEGTSFTMCSAHGFTSHLLHRNLASDPHSHYLEEATLDYPRRIAPNRIFLDSLQSLS